MSKPNPANATRVDGRRPLTAIEWATIIIAMTIALMLPAGYFALQYSTMASAVHTKAKLQANTIIQLVTTTPEMWRYQDHRLRELLQRQARADEIELERILDSDGVEVVSVGPQMEGFVLSRKASLFDSGVFVGQVEVVRPLQKLLLKTAVVAMLGVLLGTAVYGLLRALHRRTQRLNDALFAQMERARTTLHSIGDAVITVSPEEKIEYLNPAAEALTGWTLVESQGRPVVDVLQLVDEQTLNPAVSPLARAMTENSICSYSRQAALMRRDGSSVAIEDSAAPIRDHNNTVIGGVIVFRDVTAARSMAQRLSWQATHDSLTGLVNRREFENQVDAALASVRSSDKHHVICYMDLDQFKIINDTSGHTAGDEMLQQIAALLESKVRESDTLARLGGDEFGLLLEGCPLEPAKMIAAEILASVRDFRFTWEGKSFSVGVSIGLAVLGPETASRAEILSAADSALFAAKEQGRNRLFVYHSADTELANRRREMDWVARIQSALEEQRFRLYYQRYRPLKSAEDAGVHIEVLIRLIDENGTIIPPGSFLPAAERYNLMPSIDRWVVETVFTRYRELATLFDDGPLTCAINLSGTSLNAEGFFKFIHQQAAMYNLPHNAICFEVTETAAINNLRQVAAFMKEMKLLGFRFALDDFGTGTSSFGYLKNLPVDYLKIDGGFVKDLLDDPLDRAMTETINRIGHILGMQTVGEFAENEEIIGALKEMGVDYAQGYGIAKPRPLPTADDFERKHLAGTK